MAPTTLTGFLRRARPWRPKSWPRRGDPRRAARRALAWLAGITLTGFVVAGLAFERALPEARDPEYGHKLARLKKLAAASPGRPLVVAVGSSRVARGVRPGVLAGEPSAPALFNFGILGAGPVLTLGFIQRLFDDGARPDALLLELWPLALSTRPPFDPGRLRPDEWELIRRYDPDSLDRRPGWFDDRCTPWFGHRDALLARAGPAWMPEARRAAHTAWRRLDAWGWDPAAGPADDVPRQPGLSELVRHFFRDPFDGYSIRPEATAAVRECLAVCRGHGVPVALVYLPESAAFRSWYSADARRQIAGLVGELRREPGVTWVDASDWSADADLPDEFHLGPRGAAAFTRRLAERVLPGLVPATGGAR